MRSLKFPIIFLLTALACVVIFFARAKDNITMVDETRFLMGTIVQIRVPSKPSRREIDRAQDAVRKAFAEIVRVENVFSTFKVDSEISRINRKAGYGPAETTDEVLDLVERAVEYSKKTGGAFDITVKPLVELWHHVNTERKLPTDEEVKAALAKTGYAKIIIDRPSKTITFKEYGMALDLGASAKGYATGRAIEMLKSCGIRDAIVNSGGDAYCLGMRTKKEPWRVGIQHPRGKAMIFAQLKLKDAAIDTSGDYEKYFIIDGRRYSHIIDPRTGYPIGDNVVSSTIIARDPADADMLTTALCVLGEDGLGIIRQMAGVDAILVYKKGDFLKVAKTEGIDEKYDIKWKR